MATRERQPSCPLTCRSDSGRCCRLLLPIRACGQAGKWRLGSRTKRGVRCIPSAAGSTCDAWVEPCVCHVRAMLRLTRLSKTPLKKLPETLEQIQQAAPEAAVELWLLMSTALDSN